MKDKKANGIKHYEAFRDNLLQEQKEISESVEEEFEDEVDENVD